MAEATAVQASAQPSAAAPAASTVEPGYGFVPEKFWAFTPRQMNSTNGHMEGGDFDAMASLQRTVGSYNSLVQRMGDVGMRPDTPDGYEFENLPDGLTAEALQADPHLQAMLKDMHEQGFTSKQVSWAVGQYHTRTAALVPALHELDAEECVEQLRGVWKDEATFGRNMRLANRAGDVLLGKCGINREEFHRTYGNQPQVLRLLAAIGKEMAEDTSVSHGASGGGMASYQHQIAAIDKQLLALPAHDRQARLALNESKVGLFEKMLRIGRE